VITLGSGGTITDAGALTGSGALSIGAGGTLAITSGHSAIILGALTDTGLITVANGALLSAAGTIAGTGSLSIASGGIATIGGFDSNTVTDDGTLSINGSLITLSSSPFTSATMAGTIDMTGTSNGVVNFSGSSTAEVITLASVTDFGVGDSIIIGTSLVSGFKAGDSINISYLSGDQLNISDYSQLVGNPNGSAGADTVVRLNISGAGGATIGLGTGNPHLVVSSVSGVGYVITDVPCFAAGTQILATTGEIAVEDIHQGDVLVTALHGERGTSRVVWTGQRSIDIARNPRPETVLPVRITAHAFADGVPKRDLRLSPHHAVYIDGHFFQAIDLVNGTTILQEKATKSVVYYHIELTAHNVILAENLPSESFMDYDNRFMFEDPFAPIPLTLLPAFGPKGDDGLCAPLIRDGTHLHAARATLNARADELAALEPARSA
jgi:hypothetical protein